MWSKDSQALKEICRGEKGTLGFAAKSTDLPLTIRVAKKLAPESAHPMVASLPAHAILLYLVMKT